MKMPTFGYQTVAAKHPLQQQIVKIRSHTQKKKSFTGKLLLRSIFLKTIGAVV